MARTIKYYEGGKLVRSEPMSEKAERLMDELAEVFSDLDWCKCPENTDRTVYFENEHGYSHGWKCVDCGLPTQLG
jgi:hypothetical protein